MTVSTLTLQPAPDSSGVTRPGPAPSAAPRRTHPPNGAPRPHAASPVQQLHHHDGADRPDPASPVPPPPQRVADLEALGDEIARLSSHIHAAQYQLLTLLRAFDEERGWAFEGFRSCAHWLSWRTGLSLGPAREKVRVAHALSALPLISQRMERGQFSYSKVRALTRVAASENESELITFAEHGTVAQVERLVRSWRWLDREEAVRAESCRHETRALSVRVAEDGMFVVRGRLDPEVGSLLVQALEARERELYEAGPDASPDQRRADALGEVLRSGDGPHVHAIVHVTASETQTAEGANVSAETSERLTCEAHVTEVVRVHAAAAGTAAEDGSAAVDGSVLDVGRRRRTVSGRLRMALNARDGGRCRFPGCESRRCDAHHVRHWSRGGETNLDNLVLLCRFHHRQVHEGGFRVQVVRAGAGRTRVRFWRPDGEEVRPSPCTERVARPQLARWHRRHGIHGRTSMPLGTDRRVDFGLALVGMRGGSDAPTPP